MAYLAFNLNDGNEFVFDLLEDRLTLGRDVGNDIVIDNTYISGYHAELFRQEDGTYEVVDLKSSNGTYVNGKRVDRARVKGGDRLRFGQLGAKFRERAPKGLAPGEDGSKAVKLAGSIEGPSREDGRSGDTESIPLRDAAVRLETGKVEPMIRPVAALEAGKVNGVNGVGMEAVVSQELVRLRLEVADLEARREAALKEEEASVEAARLKVAKAQEELKAVQLEMQQGKAAAEAAVGARRELGNLESKKEAVQREMDRVQADVERAQGSLKTVHEEVEQSRAKAKAEHAAVEKKREELTREEEQTREALERVRAEMKVAEASLEVIRKDTVVGEEKALGLQEEREKEVVSGLEAKRAELAAVEEELATKKGQLGLLGEAESDLVKAQAALVGLRESMAQMGGERERLQVELEKAEAELAEGQAALGEMAVTRQKTVEELKEVEAVHREKAGLVPSLVAAHSALRVVEREHSAKMRERSQAEAVVVALAKKRAEEEAALEVAEAARSRKEQEAGESEKVLAVLKGQIEAAEKRAAELLTAEERLAEGNAALAELLTKRHEAEEALGMVAGVHAAKAEEVSAMEAVLALLVTKRLQEETQLREAEEGRVRQVAEAEKAMAAVQAKLETGDAAFAELLAKRQEVEEQLGRSEEEKKIKRDEVGEAEKRLAVLREQSAQAEADLRLVEEARASKLAEQSANEATLAALRAKIEDGERRAAELLALEERVAEGKTAVAELLAKRQEAEEGLRMVVGSHAAKTEEMGAVEAALALLVVKRLQEEARLKEGEEGRRLKVDEAEKALAEVRVKIEDGEKRAAELLALEVKLDEEKEALAEMEAKRQEAEGALRAVERDRQVKLEAIDEAEKSLAQLHEKRVQAEAELKERVEELAEKKSEAEKALRVVSETLATERQKVEEVNASVAERQTAFAALEQRRVELDGLLAALLAKLAEGETDAAEWEAKRRVASEVAERLELELGQRKGELEVTEKTLEETQQRLLTVQDELTAKIGRAESRLMELEADVAARVTKMAEMEALLEEKEATVKILEGQEVAIQALEEREVLLRQAVEVLTKSKGEMEAELEVGREIGRAQSSLNATLMERREAADKGCGELEAKRDGLNELVVELETKRLALEKGLEEDRKGREAFESALNEARQEMLGVEAKREGVEKETAALMLEIEGKRKERDEVDVQLQMAQTRLDEIKKEDVERSGRVEILRSESGVLEALVMGLVAKRASAETEVEERESRKQAAEEGVARLQGEAEMLKARLDGLQMEVANFELLREDQKRILTEVEGVKATLMELRAEEGSIEVKVAEGREALGALADEKRALEESATTLGAEVRDLEARRGGLLNLVNEGDESLKQIGVEVTSLAALKGGLLKETEELKRVAEREVAEREAAVKAVETRHVEVLAAVGEAEKRLEGLEELQRRLDEAITALQEVEKQRVAEEARLAELTGLLEQSRQNLELIAKQAEEEAVRVEQAAGRVGEAETNALRINEQVDTAERRLTEVGDLIAKGEMEIRSASGRCEALKAEEAELRERLPRLTAEVSEIEKLLAGMEVARKQQMEEAGRVGSDLRLKEARLGELEEELAQVNEAKARAAVVSQDVDQLTLKRDELAAALALAIGQADEVNEGNVAAKAEKERLDRELEALRSAVTALRADEVQLRGVEEQLAKLMEAKKNAEEEMKAVEQLAEQRAEREKALADAVRELEAVTERGVLAKAERDQVELELAALREKVEGVRMDEQRLAKQVGTQRSDLHAAGVALEALRQKLTLMEGQASEFTRSGGELVSVGEALMAMKARKEETQKSLKDAGEKELELQVRLGALQEAINRETARAERALKERVDVEEEFRVFAEKAQAEAQKLREERAALVKAVEELKVKKAEFAEAEAQMKRWAQIEARLRGQLEELEEKHEVMRAGLKVDEATVLMFAGDLIKRLDLIDSLRQRYAGGDIGEQLYTLRASVEDVMLQHGVVEFDVEPGTVIDVELRRRITVVDTVPGKDRPKVVETFRSGFLRVMDDGQERVLRKLEVRTSSP